MDVDSCKVATTTQTNDINNRRYNINDKLNISCTNIMFKKDIVINYKLKLDVGEDIDFIKRYLIGKKYLIKNDVLYYYNLSELTKIKMIDYSKKVLNNNWLIINNDFTICNFRAFLFSLLRICYYSIFPLSFIIKKRYTTNADEKLINEFSSLKSKYNEI